MDGPDSTNGVATGFGWNAGSTCNGPAVPRTLLGSDLRIPKFVLCGDLQACGPFFRCIHEASDDLDCVETVLEKLRQTDRVLLNRVRSVNDQRIVVAVDLDLSTSPVGLEAIAFQRLIEPVQNRVR